MGCTFVIGTSSPLVLPHTACSPDDAAGCGLATLEVAANSYIAVLGTPKYAAARLNFAQGFQGVASFAGPLIASRWFFIGKNKTSLDTVQWYKLISLLRRETVMK